MIVIGMIKKINFELWVVNLSFFTIGVCVGD